MPCDGVSCDWGGFASVLSSLNFWRGWLVTSLQHSQRGTEPALLWRLYRTGDPLASALLVCLLLAALCFLLSLPTNRHSWVDKLWSIIPVFYAWHFAWHDQLHQPGVPLNPRLLAMASLVTIWGSRLTWNFARKGGYRWEEEDYRWPWLRQRVHPFLFFIFNLTFIAVIQHVLLLALVAPAYLAWQNVGRPLGPLDTAAAALVAFFIWLEAQADQQQWAFQSAKHAALRRAAAAAKGGDRRPVPPRLARGFCTTGLFRYSRHPNFFAEQAIWWSFYLFGVAASGRWLNWTLAGPLFLSMLFQGSTWLTELITANKYPTYADYQRTTSRLMPWFPGEEEEEEEEEVEESDDDDYDGDESDKGQEEEEEEGTSGQEGSEEREEEERSEREDSSEGEGEEEEEKEAEQRPAPSARKPRASVGRRASAPAPRPAPAPASGTDEDDEHDEAAAVKEEQGQEQEQQDEGEPGEPQQRRSRRSLAATPRRRTVGGRASKAGAAAAAREQGEGADAAGAGAEEEVPAPRPSRTPRRSARSADAPPKPTRQSSRLRAKATAGSA